MRDLTAAEKEIIKRLGECWNGYLALDPAPGPIERQEFMYAIHDAQKQVMARPAVEELKK